MKRLAIVFAVPLLLSAGIASAQKPAPAGQTGSPPACCSAS